MNQFERLLSSLAGVPLLRGARCRGRHYLFDAQEGDEPDDVASERHLQALGLCQLCPALRDCERWVDSLPVRKRPLGVVAGRRYNKKSRDTWKDVSK